MHHLLKGATEEQCRAIQHQDGAAFVSAAPGSGKCLRGDTVVDTIKGPIRIDEIPRYYPVAPDGRCVALVNTRQLSSGALIQTPTSHWFDLGLSKTIRIVTSTNHKTVGTPEHRLWGTQDGKTGFWRLDQLRPGDRLLLAHKNLDTEIVSAEPDGTHRVYDFTVPVHHSFIANGFVNHNTRVITYRTAYLLDQNVQPNGIVGITFTNKAADEMKNRVKSLVEPRLARQVWLSTFHSFCVRLLRSNPQLYQVQRNFNIADEGDAKQLVTLAMSRVTGKDEKTIRSLDGTGDIRHVRKWISNQKNTLATPEDLLAQIQDDEHAIQFPQFPKFYQEYQQLLRSSNLLDFDDLIMRVVLRLRASLEEQALFGQHLQYLMVDEWQDTNFAQFELVRLLSHLRQNVFVVGDPDQCLPSTEKVLTRSGWKQIQHVKEGEQVRCGAGHSTGAWGTVEKKFKRRCNENLVVLKTRGGRTIRATPGHCVFGRFTKSASVEYVYLMFRHGKGFRIGRCGPYRSLSKDEDAPGFVGRLRQEHGDAIWVVRTCSDKREAAQWEAIYAAKYGLPTVCFHANGRRLLLDKEAIDFVYSSIDTKKRAHRLLRDRGLSTEHPHYVAQNNTDRSRRAVCFNMFGRSRLITNTSRWHPEPTQDSWHEHSCSFVCSDESIRNRVGLQVKTWDHKKGWRARCEGGDCDVVLQHAQTIAEAAGAYLRKRAKFTDQYYNFMPISNVFVGMMLPVIRDDGTVIEDEVVEVQKNIKYNGYVYDLSIPNYRNYCASGILVHNSIYMFRGADAANTDRFYKTFDDVETFFLQTNFRSVPGIAQVANLVIQNNERKHEKTIVPHKQGGQQPQLVEVQNRETEARFIIGTIRDMVKQGADWKDFAIIYRIRSLSRSLEDEAVAHNIPYRVIGALSFYNRAVIKDILGYCRLLISPNDDAAFTRIYNKPPRYLGPVAFAQFSAAAEQHGFSLMKTMRKGLYTQAVRPNAAAGFRALKQLYKTLRDIGPDQVGPVVRHIIRYSGYQHFAEQLKDPDRQARVQEDLGELETAAASFDARARSRGSKRRGVGAFLEHATLMQQDDPDEDRNKVLLMTAHAAKGLEFPNVFLCGAVEGVLPLNPRGETGATLMDPAAIKEHYAEERRVFYVAITRAEERLWITYPQVRRVGANMETCVPSRYCREAGATLRFVDQTKHRSKAQGKNADEITRLRQSQLDDDHATQYRGKRQW